MMQRTKTDEPISKQMKRRKTAPKEKEYDGNFGQVIHTGSTILDLNISGGRIRGGGIPGGIFVEAFGPSGSGKTVLLSEIAGDVQRQSGELMFHDPEARLNQRFAQMFGLNLEEGEYYRPNTVTEVFSAVRKWEPENEKTINGIFADSLAALSTDMEMDEGDPFGGRRAKEFSEQLRVTCRLLAEKNYLMICSNQVRDIIGASQYQPKTKSPGGRALEFYPSLRLQFSNPKKLTVKKTIAKKVVSQIVGVETDIFVFKSSLDMPFRTSPVTILFDYGIDDLKQNLQFIKDHTTNTVYNVGTMKLDKSMAESIKIVEDEGLELKLKEEVINLWEEIQTKFQSKRKVKRT